MTLKTRAVPTALPGCILLVSEKFLHCLPPSSQSVSQSATPVVCHCIDWRGNATKRGKKYRFRERKLNESPSTDRPTLTLPPQTFRKQKPQQVCTHNVRPSANWHASEEEEADPVCRSVGWKGEREREGGGASLKLLFRIRSSLIIPFA